MCSDKIKKLTNTKTIYSNSIDVTMTSFITKRETGSSILSPIF